MPYFHGMPKIVSWDNESITVLDGVDTKATFHYSLDDVAYKVTKVEQRIKYRNRNAAWAELRKNSVSISEPVNQVSKAYSVRPGMTAYLPEGVYHAQFLDVETTDFGLRVKMKVGEREDLMSKHDSKDYPDKDYRFTAIAPVAQSLTYHGKRQWFKTKAACKTFCEDVFGKEHPKSFVLAIVEAKELIEPKKTIETVSTVLAK
jgi:hypothetical protein